MLKNQNLSTTRSRCCSTQCRDFYSADILHALHFLFMTICFAVLLSFVSNYRDRVAYISSNKHGRQVHSFVTFAWEINYFFLVFWNFWEKGTILQIDKMFVVASTCVIVLLSLILNTAQAFFTAPAPGTFLFTLWISLFLAFYPTWLPHSIAFFYPILTSNEKPSNTSINSFFFSSFYYSTWTLPSFF